MEIFPNCVDRSERIDQDLGLGMNHISFHSPTSEQQLTLLQNIAPQQLGNIDEKSKT